VRNYARYRIVSGTDEWQREMGVPEFKPEDWVLNQYGRGKMLDLARNAARNSSTLASILKQLDVNVIGAKGGKCITDDEAIKEEFSKWTREADFFDGLSFNSVLKLILKT